MLGPIITRLSRTIFLPSTPLGAKVLSRFICTSFFPHVRGIDGILDFFHLAMFCKLQLSFGCYFEKKAFNCLNSVILTRYPVTGTEVHDGITQYCWTLLTSSQIFSLHFPFSVLGPTRSRMSSRQWCFCASVNLSGSVVVRFGRPPKRRLTRRRQPASFVADDTSPLI